MKELSIQEKARRYDEAIKEASIAYKDEDKHLKATLERIFPELKESEDEKLREQVVYAINQLHVCECTKTKLLAWLEKQGQKETTYDEDMLGAIEYCKKNNRPLEKEHIAWLEKKGEKPQGKSAQEVIKEEKVDNANKLEPKFKVGDYVVDNCGYLWRVEGVINQFYILEGIDGGESRPTIEWVNKTFHLWDITKDAKDGDLIYVSTEAKGIQAIFHKFENGIIYFHCYLCGDFMQGGYMPIESVERVYSLQKTHYKRFFQKMKESGYEWDAEKKELKKIELRQEELTEFEKSVKQMMEEAIECGDIHNLKADADMLLRLAQKPAWSEDDENMRLDLIQYFADGYGLEHNLAYIVDWLKSLKPQKQWKPSENQIEALIRCVDYLEESDNEDLLVMESLLEQLKSLK